MCKKITVLTDILGERRTRLQVSEYDSSKKLPLLFTKRLFREEFTLTDLHIHPKSFEISDAVRVLRVCMCLLYCSLRGSHQSGLNPEILRMNCVEAQLGPEEVRRGLLKNVQYSNYS